MVSSTKERKGGGVKDNTQAPSVAEYRPLKVKTPLRLV